MNWLERLDDIWPRTGAYIEPLSEDWRQARRGRLTASSAAHVIPKWTDKGIATLREKLLREMADGYKWTELDLPQLNWGREHEKAAIATIELTLGVDMPEPGMLFHPKYPFCTSTPDGLIDGHISVQIKCPHKRSIHLEYLYQKPILKIGARGGRAMYWYQVQWEAWTSSADQILFCTFDPDQPLATKLGVCEVPIDHEMHELFEKNSLRFKNYIETGRSTSQGTVKPIGIPQLF